MRQSRAALGRNPLQESLLDTSTLPIFGDPVEPTQIAQIKGQQCQVEKLMSDGNWHTLPELQKELKRRFGYMYSETSVSARLRGMRKRGFTVTHERTRPGSNLYQYRAVKNSSAADADERARTAALLETYRPGTGMEAVA